MRRTFQTDRRRAFFRGSLGVCLLMVAALANAPATATSEPVRTGGEIIADAPLQAAIQSFAAASNRAEADARLARIRTLCDRDHGRLIDQLLLYDATCGNAENAKSCVGLILEDARIPKEAAVTALVVHLDNANPSIQRMVCSLLHGYEDGSATRPPDFSTYRTIIETAVRAGKEPSDSLVKFMYETDPGTALLTMMRGYQLRDPNEMKPILWAEHVIADMFWKRQFGFLAPQEAPAAAVNELDTLSRHERWWVRLYVAELLYYHPELRRPEMFDRLREDRHAVVREALLGKQGL
jgi:hypothetical protein